MTRFVETTEHWGLDLSGNAVLRVCAGGAHFLTVESEEADGVVSVRRVAPAVWSTRGAVVAVAGDKPETLAALAVLLRRSIAAIRVVKDGSELPPHPGRRQRHRDKARCPVRGVASPQSTPRPHGVLSGWRSCRGMAAGRTMNWAELVGLCLVARGPVTEDHFPL